MTGIICSPKLYEYKGVVFEVHSYCGPHPLKRNMEPRKIIPKSFWVLWKEFDSLPEIEQEYYRIGGGCIRI